jgi:prepilin peptidase CpaA
MITLAHLQLLALLALLSAAVYTDLKERKIPNKITVSGLLAGLVIGAVLNGGSPLMPLAGAALAFLISFPMVALGAIGAGDAKLLTAVGSFVGPGGVLSVILYGALAGGVLALVATLTTKTFRSTIRSTWKLFLHLITLGRHGARIGLDSPGIHAVPYGLAIAAGALATWFFPFSLGGSL